MKFRGVSKTRKQIGRCAVVALVLALTVCAGAWAANKTIRTIDGHGNNLDHDDWGRAGTKLLRLTTVDYGDGRSTPAGADRPGARAISNASADQPASKKNAAGMSHFIWAWGQFVDHDISLTGSAEPREEMSIPVPAGDPFFDPAATGRMTIPFARSVYGKGKVRQQLNQITAWIDASQVYGSDEARARALRRRKGTGDRLKNGGNRLLPHNRKGFANAPSDLEPSMFLAGDVRANENAALTSLHVLFVREHNRITRMLRRRGGLTAEQRYQLARALVGAEMQAITFNEFLPALLGPDAIAPYDGYDPTIHPGIANIFSTACYRIGHSMLPSRLPRIGADGEAVDDGHLRLRDAFFAPGVVVESGIEPFLRGLASARSQEVDSLVIDDVRNFLFGKPGQGGFDLAALNIQRGRDHGLPSYNQARTDFGLAPAATFADVTSDVEAQQRLAGIYDSVDDIDVWVGVLSEDHVPGAMVGEVAFHVLRDQFERLRDGDRFWYQNGLPEEFHDWPERHPLAEIIRLNTDIGDELRDDLFSMP
ncbi:MAG: peroxidase family protein [Thermoanaerobaculia bacterium]